MTEKAYISRIRRHKIVVKPTIRRIDGTIIPGKVIEFDDHRYVTSDPEEQKAIESSIDFRRYIFPEGDSPKTPEQIRQEELAGLRAENARLAHQLEALKQQMEQLMKAQAAAGGMTAVSGGSSYVTAGANGSNRKPPEGTKCEEITRDGKPCKRDAVTERDGMWVCAQHAQD